MEDKELIRLMRKHPEEGIQALMGQYMGFCYAIVGQRLAGFPQEDVEECVSDIFLELFRCRERIDLRKGSIKTFLGVLSRRRAIDRYEKVCREGSLPLSEEYKAEEKAVSSETKAVLEEALKRLGEPDNRILVWKYYFGYSTKAIAEALEIKENTVDQKAKRALEKMRKIMEGGMGYEG